MNLTNEKINDDNTKKSFIHNLLKLMRPKQWVKNFFVIGPLIFSLGFLDPKKILSSFIAFILFCLISSTVYIMNDIVDIEKDKMHPKKKNRPLASEAIKIPTAIVSLLILLSISLIGSYLINFGLFIIMILYFINNILYSFKIKHVVIIDVISIAIGFILRVIAGGIAIDVTLSGWILLCTFFISLFLGFEKRKNEILKLQGNANEHRKILDDYSEDLLNQISNICVPCTLVSYAIYTFIGHPNPYMMLTNLFVVYGLFRYKYLVIKKGEGGSPTEALITDKALIINIILWAIASMIILLWFN